MYPPKSNLRRIKLPRVKAVDLEHVQKNDEQASLSSGAGTSSVSFEKLINTPKNHPFTTTPRQESISADRQLIRLQVNISNIVQVAFFQVRKSRLLLTSHLVALHDYAIRLQGCACWPTGQ